MAAKGEKAGKAVIKKRKILKLKPITYSLSLVYLGNQRVTWDNSYRCGFEIDDGATAVAALAQIPNVVTGNPANDSADDQAAKSVKDSGDMSAPSSDRSYRLLIHDNHTGKLADKSSVTWADKSRAEYYADNNWIRDVRPAVPFRVIVRRYSGDDQVPVTATDLKVLIEVKDPPEELTQCDGLTRTFLTEFFKKYNQNTGHATAGDDNRPEWGEASAADARTHPGTRGVDASKVLRKMAYKKKPDLDTGTADKDAVAFTDLTDAAKHAATGGILLETLDKVDETGPTGEKNKVLVGDFAFYPWPAGGDNYRFLLRLFQGTDDIRTKSENGKQVELFDFADNQIASPRAYTTGKFTLWTKVRFCLVVLVNELTKADIPWNQVQAKHRKAFVEIAPPPDSGYFNLPKAEWLRLFKAEFDPSGWKFPLAWREMSITGRKPIDYTLHFYPPFLYDKEADAHTHPLTREIIKYACTQMSPVLSHPFTGGDDAQQQPNGHYAVVMRQLKPDHSDLGEFVYDRHLNVMVGSVTPLQLARTVAHEIGHSMQLRHSLTSAEKATLDGTDIMLLDPNKNCEIRNHDNAHAPECLMGYTGKDDAHFCGICALLLRRYPIQKIKEAGNYGDETISHYTGGAIVNASYSTDHWDLTSLSNPHDLDVGDQLALIAIGPAHAYERRWHNDNKTGHVILTSIKHSTWTPSVVGKVDIDNRGQYLLIEGASAGAVTLTFQVNAVSITCNLNVNP